MSTQKDNPELGRFCVKFYVGDPGTLDLTEAIPIFHRWIQSNRVDGLLLDVVDYRHVPDGPGVVLVGHDADYFLDVMEGPLGMLYSRKRPSEGSNVYRLRRALGCALTACKALEQEPELAAKGFRFEGGRLRFIINDRLLSSNGVVAIRDDLDTVLRDLYPAQTMRIQAGSADPRERYTLDVESGSAVDVATLLKRLESRKLRSPPEEA